MSIDRSEKNNFKLSNWLFTFITQHPTPAILADALPRSIASTVHAARIAVALCAGRPRPSHLATALAGTSAVAALAVAAGGADC